MFNKNIDNFDSLPELNKMLIDDPGYNRKHFSKSIKNAIIPVVNQRENPELPSKTVPLVLRERRELNHLRKKNQTQLIKLQQQQRSYEKMVDEMMKKHVEEQHLPLLMSKIAIRHTYKSYRVIHQNQAAEEVVEKDEGLIEKIKKLASPRERKRLYFVTQDRQARSTENQGRKSEGKPMYLPSLAKNDQQTHQCLRKIKTNHQQPLNSHNFAQFLRQSQQKSTKRPLKSYTQQ